MPKHRTLVIATRNTDKLAEIKRLLKSAPFRVRSLNDFKTKHDVVEDRPTFEGNARKKAREYSRITRALTLADDSGIMVTALKGAPGVYSARFAGPGCSYADNNAKLLKKLAGKKGAQRSAKFVCVMALYDGGRFVRSVRGECLGRVADAVKGANGFGYDPVFVPRGQSRTFAQLSKAKKNALSHRGKALRKTVKYLLGTVSS